MTLVHRLATAPAAPTRGAEHIWYASYGSNMDTGRLRYYLTGGRPPGAARTYPGCRDRRPPVRSAPVEFPGTLYFATESPVWQGGRAFYDPTADGIVWGRAHLVTVQQFSDIAAQEMYEFPGKDLDLATVLTDGRAALGPGRYETLVLLGHLEDIPVLTFTAPWRLSEVTWNKPSAPYLLHLAHGLCADGTWEPSAVARYLSRCPGAAKAWTPGELTTLIEGLEGPEE
ncbi:histone deacetylase [Streptomyces sp. NPDC086835]|uniref:histone deacetylase n=1 Tax=Streptomyces sp. NPDC086835 TaxID=3365761 RepID=UPI00381F620B